MSQKGSQFRAVPNEAERKLAPESVLTVAAAADSPGNNAATMDFLDIAIVTTNAWLTY